MISVVRRFRCLLHEILAACCESSYCRFSMREPLWTYLACVDAYICWINYQPNMSFFPRVSWHGLPSAPRFTNHFTCLRITTWPSVSCSQFASLFYPLENKNRYNRCFLIETFCIFTCWWLRWRCNIHPTWFQWWTHSTNFTSWGHGLSPPWNSISNRHGDPMLSNWMIYLGIVWNGSYGQQDSYRRVARLKKMFFCVCLTFKNIYNIYNIYHIYHCIHRPLGLSSLHIFLSGEIKNSTRRQVSKLLFWPQQWIEIHWFWSKFPKLPDLRVDRPMM